MSKIFGPYLRKDGRQHIVIQHEDGRLQTKSYPKHLLEQKLGRELLGEETCDHVDENFTNDDLVNLQVLTRSENAAKAMVGREVEMYHFVCPVCHIPTVKEMRNVRHNWNQGRSGPVCSKECAGLVGKVLIRYETTYNYDPVTQEVTVTNESWEID